MAKSTIFIKNKEMDKPSLQLVCKPSSVIESRHQSRHDVAIILKRSRERTSSPYVPHLASHGVYSKPLSPIARVSSYLTFSPLPYGGIFLLHFSSSRPGLTLSSVIALRCSDFPHKFLCAPAQLTIIL